VVIQLVGGWSGAALEEELPNKENPSIWAGKELPCVHIRQQFHALRYVAAHVE
jgi:hypothetical protein